MHRVRSIERTESAGRGSSRGRQNPSPARCRLRVTMEDGESFLLQGPLAASLELEEGAEIPEELYEKILKELESSCMQRCGTLLGARDYSVRRLREKLAGAGFPSAVIDESVRKLREAGYLDDARYARSYVRSHLRDRSRLRMIRDLSERGISGQEIEEALAAVGEEEDLEAAQRGQILRLMEKRGYDPETASYEESQKIMAFLHRKGYSPEVIRRMAAHGSSIRE